MQWGVRLIHIPHKQQKDPKFFTIFFTLDQATSPAGRKLCISPQQSNEEQHLPAHDSYTWPTCRRYAYFFFFSFLMQKQTNVLFFFSSMKLFFAFLLLSSVFSECVWIFWESSALLWCDIHTPTKTFNLGNVFITVKLKLVTWLMHKYWFSSLLTPAET